VLHEAFVEFKPLYTEAGFAATALQADQIIARMAEGPVWIALHETTMLGTVAAVKKEASVYIRGMGVLPAARGSGTGSRLLQQAENWARREGIFTLFLSTTPFLDAAIHLYERSGFRRLERGSNDLFGTLLFTMEKSSLNS
jgi:GNAT superfamily N-acetyltransferase